MVIKRYIVTICTATDEQKYSPSQVASYVQEGLVSDNDSEVTAVVVDAEYLDDGILKFTTNLGELDE